MKRENIKRSFLVFLIVIEIIILFIIIFLLYMKYGMQSDNKAKESPYRNAIEVSYSISNNRNTDLCL